MKYGLKILLYSNYLNIFGYSLFGPLYSIFVLEVGGSAFHAGASWGLYMLIAGLLMFYFSKIADQSKTSRKNMIIAAYFILAFGALAFTLIKNPIHIYLVQIINAIGVGLLDPAWKAMYAGMEDKGEEAQEWAWFDGGDKIIIAIAAFLGGIFVTYFSFKYLFVFVFLIQLIAALISIKILRNNRIQG